MEALLRRAALPEALGDLSLLQELRVAGNALTALPDSVGRLSALVELFAHDNRLTALPDSVGDLLLLQKLWDSVGLLMGEPVPPST